MGEFSPPLFLSPLLFLFSYPSNIEILFDFSYFSDGFITLLQKFTPHFKILDPCLIRRSFVLSSRSIIYLRAITGDARIFSFVSNKIVINLRLLLINFYQ